MEVVDEEEGHDTLSDLPTSLPSPTKCGLQGLERELSTRHFAGGGTTNAVTTASSPSNINSSGRRSHPNFTDYLQAQRRLSSRSTAVETAVSAVGSDKNNGVGRDDNNSDNYASNMASVATKKSALQKQKTLRALETLGRRGSAANLTGGGEQNAIMRDDIFEEMETIDEDGHFVNGHDNLLPWYSPPIQRQRWGEDQILPHVNWGDLFFDLFYVAMAYNLGVMLTSAMNDEHWLRGILYYVGTFGPLWITWETSMFFESRYTIVDYAHRLFEVIRYLFVSTAVVHVKSVELLSDPKSLETLLFTCAILCESLMHLGLNVELYFRGQGDTETIKHHTLGKIKVQCIPVILIYSSAVITAAVLLAMPEDGKGNNDDKRLLAGEEYPPKAADGTYEPQASHPEPIWLISDLPLTLTAFGYLLNLIALSVRKFLATSGKIGDIRALFVPNNVDYVIHRYGEWVLLMIGEGILSLLIVVPAETPDYYIITTFGVLTVIFVQVLKFESEPSHAEGHALWKNLLNGMGYSWLIQILSMALIVYGVTYKVFLQDVVKDAEKAETSNYRKAIRMLASSPAITNEASAAVFSAALTVVLLSLELMCLTHSGIKQSLEHLFHRSKDGKASAPHWPIVIISLFKVAIFLFAITLNQWTVDPATLTICGFGIVFALAVSRILNYMFIYQKQAIQKLRDTVRRPIRLSDAGECNVSEQATAICTKTKNVITHTINETGKKISIASDASREENGEPESSQVTRDELAPDTLD